MDHAKKDFIKSCLFTENLEAVLERRESLVAGLAGRGTEDELSVELPRSGDVPLLLDALVDQGAVVLEVGAETFGLKGGPDWKTLSVEWF